MTIAWAVIGASGAARKILGIIRILLFKHVFIFAIGILEHSRWQG